ncbi:multiheme c-type cytochrome [Microbulbifer sp. JMSA003]|uniref:multiheme c-type cytochrome n=1 Tax=Microbulbifer sp. JMSA003 TaxID=3243369 RepID=UPI004039B59F
MKSNTSLLNKERKILSIFLSSLSICTISGLLIFFAPKSLTFNQVNILGHVAVGFSLTIAIIFYAMIHFKRTLGIRKPAVLISGIIAITATFAYIYSGLHLAYFGHTEANANISYWHKVGSLIVILLIIVHVIFHRILKYRARPNNPTARTYNWETAQKSTTLTAIYFIAVILLTTSYSWLSPTPEAKNFPGDYELAYGEHPFRPSQSETSNGGFIHEKQIAGSEQCALCHEDITRQWYSSAHRQASSDPTYVTNISLLSEKKGIAATRYCEGCHSPIALLTGQLTPGGKHGGIPGTRSHSEGISCLSCHAMANTVHLDGVGSYLYKPPEPYLFAYSDVAFLKGISNYLTKISTSQHKQDLAPEVISEAKQCSTCHTQFMDKEINNWGWVKMQDEYSAWLNSPFSRQHQQTFSTEAISRCQDCHMPLVSSTDPSANTQGMVRSHRFIAANTMLPLLSGDVEQLELTKKFLQSNKLRVTIEKPSRSDAIQSGVSLDENLRTHTETPDYHYLGETVKLNVLINNIGVGHEFPGGTIDLNQAWVELIVKDSNGQSIYSSGQLSNDGYVDPDAHFYRSIPVDRHGKQVWNHALFNMVGETYKNVIEPGGSDIVEYNFKIPNWAKGPLVIDATVKYRKLNQRYAKWALKEKFQELPIVDMARDTLILEILHEKEVM